MFRKLLVVCILASVKADTRSSYGAPSYQAPSYNAPVYKKDEVVHTHHHYHHDSPPPKPTYHAPAPSYAPPAPSYNPPAPSYAAPSYAAPTYASPAPAYNYAPYHGHTYYDDDEYIHLNKKEVTRGALLFGAGLLKGVVLTGLINNANNGITIGK